MTRKQFVQLSTGLLGGLGINEALDQSAHRSESDTTVPVLDDSYLVKGLNGMAQSKGWFRMVTGSPLATCSK